MLEAYQGLMDRLGFVPANHSHAQLFPMAARKIYDETGVELPGYRRIVREDNEHTLNVVGDRYGLVDNKVAFAQFEDAIAQSTLDKRDMVVATDYAAEGARVFRCYMFPQHLVEVRPGVPVALRVLMQNSYDGTMAFTGRAGAYSNSPYQGSLRHPLKGAVGAVVNDTRVDWSAAWGLFPGDVAYVWHAGRNASAVQTSLEAAGFGIRAQVIWAKSHFAIGRGHYHPQHEPCWYAVRDGSEGHWCGDRSQSTLWTIDKPQRSETGHSTQKPTECMRRPMLNNSAPGDAVYDPFVGSGTTILAAETIKRGCYAVEINPAYCDLAIRRWQDFTRQQAVLAGEDRTFDDVADARSPASVAG